jgi:hypothetical protein
MLIHKTSGERGRREQRAPTGVCCRRNSLGGDDLQMAAATVVRED